MRFSPTYLEVQKPFNVYFDMANVSAYRDMSLPYSEEEIQGLLAAFVSQPTYDLATDSVSADDFPALVVAMRYERTPEQVQSYIDFYKKSHNGRVTQEVFITSAQGCTNPTLYAEANIRSVDQNKNGFVDPEELKNVMDLLVVQDPKFLALNYDEFLEAADKSADGKVSLEECAAWIKKVENVHN